MNTVFKRSILILPIIMLGTLSLLYFGALLPDVIPSIISASLTGNDFVDAKLKYQIVTFGIALLVLGITYAFAPQNARRFYKPGDINAPAEPVKWLDIKPTDTWNIVGRNFAIVVSLATGVFIYFNVARGQSLAQEHLSLLPFILVLSALNAFTEEAITRLSVITALDGIVSRPVIYIVSALIFGIPHYFGVPGGILGSLMAGFLGWLLAKSIAETEGMFWAWFIHFLQDVIIFAGLFLVAL
jgi:membrane protease YdiL (CAAX protease family)